MKNLRTRLGLLLVADLRVVANSIREADRALARGRTGPPMLTEVNLARAHLSDAYEMLVGRRLNGG